MHDDSRYEYTTAAELGPPVPVERDSPRDVVVSMPREIAAWTAGAVTILLWLVLGWVGSMGWMVDWLTPRWPVVVFVPPIVGLTVFIGLFLAISPRRMLVHFENRYGVDIDHDGYIGQPPGEKTVRLELSRRGGTRVSFLSTDMEPEMLRKFAALALAGRTSVRAMSAAGVKQELLEALRGRMFDHELAGWRHGEANQGWELNEDGRAAMEEYLRTGHVSPTLT